MGSTANILLAFGIVPTAIVIGFFYVYIYGSPFVWAFLRKRFDYGESAFISENETEWHHSQKSAMQPIFALPSRLVVPADEPQFTTLRVGFNLSEKANWEIAIQFTIYNRLTEAAALYDLHVIKYLDVVPTPPKLTLGLMGYVRLRADNHLCIADPWPMSSATNPSSFPNGYQATLILDAARMEGSPFYGGGGKEDGPLRVVFGIFVDYLVETRVGIEKRAIPSDAIYLLEKKSPGVTSSLGAISNNNVSQYGTQLAEILNEHLSTRPVPLP